MQVVMGILKIHLFICSGYTIGFLIFLFINEFINLE